MSVEEQLLKIKREAEEREARRKAEKFNLEYLDLSLKPVETDALKLVPENKARQLQISPIQLKGDDLSVGVFDPENSEVKKSLEELTAKNYKLKIYTVSLSGLERAWSFYNYLSGQSSAIHGRFDIEKERLENLLNKLGNFELVAMEIKNYDFKTSPTSQVLEVILAGAMANRASDVHFEAEADDVKIRFRVDGILHDVIQDLAKNIYTQILNRIKLLANLKLNVQREPQDGRFTIRLTNKEVEARVSVIPSEFGETIVMRILDPESLKITLDDLGFREDDLAIIREELKQPNGMILNSGPTGSGKTTTLYSFLKTKQAPEIKIITIEDPIEYHLEGIEQTQVSDDGDYTFANGLRSVMRQDPDVILIGEIRDKETVEIGMQAALTGHLVFSTVHANNAAGVVPRLIDLGVKPSSIGPALNLIIAQRLVRKLCERCKKPAEPELIRRLADKIQHLFSNLPAKIDKSKYQNWQLFSSVGCLVCGGTGYRGRVGVFELLKIDSEIEKFINQQVGEAELHDLAIKQGMVTIQQDGLLKVISGITTIEEVENATGLVK